MGPILILDKSTLQSLTIGEMRRLERHYSLNIPPVLLLETLADLKKDEDDATRSQQMVSALARRLLRGETKFNLHHKEICYSELLGAKVEMQRLPVLGPGRDVPQPDGTICRVYDVTWQNRVLINWIEGAFSEAENLMATELREVSSATNVAAYQARLNEHYVIVPRANDLVEILACVDDLLSNPRMQKLWLNWIMDELRFSTEAKHAIHMSWQHRSTTFLSAHAPYTFLCLRINLAFVFGLIRELISSRSTQKTRIDLEYCYYLPFCMVFASTDSFHRRFAPLFLNENQKFVNGNDLRADLNALDAEWQAMTMEEKKSRDTELGSRPPKNLSSVTWQVWQKLMRPSSEPCGNRASQMPQDEKDKLVRHIRSLAESAERQSVSPGDSSGKEPISVISRMQVPRSEVTDQHPDFE